MDEIKEWVKVTKPAKGPMIATVTVLRSNCTARASVACWGLKDSVKNGVKDARAKAREILFEIEAALSELEEAA